jgi:hypothetical protein
VSLSSYAAVLAAALVYIVARERFRVTISATLLIALWLLHGAGYFYSVAAASDWTRLNAHDYTHVSERLTLAFTVMWGGLFVGMELARVAAGRATAYQLAVARSWNSTPVEGHGGKSLGALPVVVAWAITAILLAGFLAWNRLEHISQFVTSSSAIEKIDLRLRYAPTGSYAYDVLLAVYAPYVCCYLFVMWLIRRTLAYGTAFLALAAAIDLCEFATLEKLPWVLFLLQLLVAHTLVRSIAPKVWRIVLILMFVIGAVSVGATLAMPNLDWAAIANYLLYRSTYITNESLYQTFYVYPDYLPHTLGYNIGLIQTLFGQGQHELAQSVVAAFFGAPESTFNAMFIADAWVDFGFAGVAVMSVIVGLVVKLCDCYYFSLGKSAACIAGVAASMHGVLALLSTAAPTAFLSGGLVLLPATLVSLRLLRELLSGTSTESLKYSQRMLPHRAGDR